MIPDLSNSDQHKRIMWRQRLMQCEGGPDWLLHCARLYGFRERLCGGDHLGLPAHIARQMAQEER